MRLPGTRTRRTLRIVAAAAFAAGVAASAGAGTLDDRALARALDQSGDALREGRPAEALAALRAQLPRLERSDAAHRARFARAAQVAVSRETALRVEQARAAYDAGQGRLLALLREAVAPAADVEKALAEARELHARIEAAAAPSPVSAGPRVRAPRLAVPPLPAAGSTLEPQGLEPPIGSVPLAIRQAADALAGPIDVYEWVRNTIRPEFYHGRMKGPLETFLERSGNDVDTASVLVEMLRAKGVPARYVRGVAELPAAAVRAMTGAADTTQALRVLARAGIPHEPISGPAGPTAVRLHRVWVEAFVPYANYRGAAIDQQGSLWLPLDAAFKPLAAPSGRDVAALGFDARQAFDDYLAAPQAETPRSVVRSRVAALLETHAPGTTYAQALNQRTFDPQRLGLLPSTLPYKVALVSGVGYDVDEDLRQRLHVVGTDDDGVFLDARVDIADVLGRRVTIGYRPETADDLRIASSYGGMHLTPPYLIKVLPALKIGGVPAGVATRGIGMAVRYELRVVLETPGGREEAVNHVQAGNLLALGLAGRQPSVPDESTTADQILSRIAIGYFARWNESDDELADLLRVVPVRPTPSLCLARSDVEVEYAGGDPQFPLTFDWKGILVDADLRAAAPAGVESAAAEQRFLLLSGLEGSVLEDRVFADGLQIPAVSTAQVLGLAAGQGTTVHDLTRENVDQVLPGLPYHAEVKEEIRDAALAGLLVRVPAAPVTRLAWTGVGYVLLDEETGEAAWQLQGGHSGGVTAPAVIDLPHDVVDPLVEQGETIEPAPEDAQVATIQRFVSTDFQEGTVDKPLETPLRVLVTDADGRAVRNANVVFTVIGGGGTLTAVGTVAPEAVELTVRSDARGEAQVVLRLGKRTDEIPRLAIPQDPEREPTLIGLNLVTARVGSVALPEPFSAFGVPDEQFDGVHWHAYGFWEGNYVQAIPQGAVAGRIGVTMKDQHGNPISNWPMNFTYRPPAIAWDPPPGYVRNRPANDSPSWLLTRKDYAACTLTHPVPLTGDCPGQVATVRVVTTFMGAAQVYVAFGTSPGSLYYFDVAGDLGYFGWEAFVLTGHVCPISDPVRCEGAVSESYISTGMRPFRANSLGNIIEAYPLGESGSVGIWADAISEIERVEVETDPDGQVHYIGYGTNQWRRERLSDSEIELRPATPGTVPAPTAVPAGNGRYVANVRMANAPQLNRVEVEGRHYPYDLVRKDHWRELDPAYVDPVTLQATRVRAPWGPAVERSAFSLWGVRLQLHDLEPVPIRVGPQGIVSERATVQADIEPAAYAELLAPLDVQFRITRESQEQPVLAANGTAGAFDIPAGMPYPPERHTAHLSVLGVSVTQSGGGANVTSPPYELPGCYLLDLRTPVVPLAISIDSLNGTSCASQGILKFSLCRDARVTLQVDGAIFTSAVDEGAPVPIQDLYLAAGDHTISVPAAVLAYPLMIAQTAQVPFQLRAVAADDPSVAQDAPGIIAGEALNRSVLPVGHPLVKDVDLTDGHLVMSRTDVAVAGRHLGLTALRVYSTAGVSRGGVLGAGWAFSYESYLTETPCSVVAQTPDGRNQVFTRLPDGSYKAQRGYHSRLVRNPSDGSFDFFDLAGNRYHYFEPDGIAALRSRHRLRYIEEPHGDRVELTYDGQDRVSRVAEVHPESGTVRWMEMRYVRKGGFDRIASITSSVGLGARYSYDAYGNLLTAERTASPDVAWNERYDYTVENTFDRHQVVAVRDANGHRTTYAYYRESDVIQGWTLGNSLPKNEYVKTVTEYPGSGPGVVTEFLYDLTEVFEDRRAATVRDARGNATRYVMRGDGATIELHQPLGRTTAFVWALDDVLKESETDANGRVTRFTHDARGNETSRRVESADGSETETIFAREYEPSFNRLVFQDEGGNVTRNTIDPADGDLLATLDPVGAETRYEYDDHGQLVSVTDHDEHVTTHADHDSFGNARAITRPEGLLVNRTYDERGRLLVESDSHGRETRTDYDGFDRVIRTERRASDPQSEDEVTRTAYFPDGHVRETTGANGARSVFTLDGMNRVIGTEITGPGLPEPIRTEASYDGNGNLVEARDERGVLKRSTFDALNQLVQVEILAGPGGGPTGTIQKTTYDAVGNKTSERDLANLETRFEYDLRYRVEKRILPESGPSGRYFEEYEYDAADNLTLRRDANGHVRTFGYDGHKRRTSWQDDNGHSWSVTYDLASGRMDQKALEHDLTAGLRTTWLYDGLHRETERRVRLNGAGGDGAEYVTTMDHDGLVSSTTDPRNVVTRVERDALDRPIRQVVDPEGLALETRTSYDGLGRPTKLVDARGNATTHEYDALGRLQQTVDADQKRTRFEYDGGGLKTRETDRREVQRDFTYDTVRRLRKTTLVPSLSGVPWSSETLYEDVARRRIAIDALGRQTVQQLDGLGRVVRETDPDDKYRLFTYDGVNKRSETDKRPEHFVTEFTYDAFDRLVETRYPALAGGPGPVARTTAYEDAANRRVDTDRRGIATTTSMDPLGRVREVARADALPERHTYDGNGNRLTSLDAESRETRFEYDAANRPTARTDGFGTLDASTMMYTPDPNGNVVAERDARAAQLNEPFSVKRVYDALDRMREETDGEQHTTASEYDPEGNRTLLRNPEGDELRYEYEELAKVSRTIEAPTGTPPATAATQHTYDANRNRKTQTDARDHTVAMHYDELGRLESMIQPGDLATRRDYDANGNVLVLTDPKGQTVTSTYDEWNRVKTKTYTFAPGDSYRPWRWLASVAYVYDANDNVTRIEETVASGTDPPPSAPNQITERTYDDFDRMLSETVTLPDGGTKTVRYTYYKNGNRKTVADPAGVVTSYTYDGQEPPGDGHDAGRRHAVHALAGRPAENGRVPERRRLGATGTDQKIVRTAPEL